jgi:ABC-type branched-subunit amino acid transport system ATPase component
MTVVLLEQSLGRAASACHEVVVLHEGGIAVRGEPGDPMFLARAEQAYFDGQDLDGQDDSPMVAAQG